MGKVNRSHKNSVFFSLFSDPDILRELYSAIEGVTIPPDISIKINTLRDILYKDQINDLSFTIDNRLVVLIEHQSTVNENIPLRLLMYIARVYEKIIKRRKRYQNKLEKIPKPEFYQTLIRLIFMREIIKHTMMLNPSFGFEVKRKTIILLCKQRSHCE